VFVLATATSAVRDADNGDAFLGEIEHGFGFRAQLLSGDEEASATWAGVTSDPTTAARAAVGTGVLVDIGGGSTEILLSDAGAVTDRHSFQLGSVRVTERFLAGQDVLDRESMHAARAAIRSELRTRFPDPRVSDLAIGVAGTATTVSAILLDHETYDPDAVHGFSFTREDVDSIIDRLAALPLTQRRAVRGLEPDRAPVIVGGLLILSEVLEQFQIARIETSERDILDGIALMAGRIALDEGIDELPEPFGRTVC
jgi:exopolyphosphatase/guanosine-5'-triphosphate,3'-diphosphate pyrophosphatase